MERDDAHWAGMSRSVERGEYTAVGPVELGPAAVPLRLTRITLYTPAVVLRHVAAAYAALLNAEPTSGEDERGAYVEVTGAAGFTIELRPAEAGEVPTVTRLEFRGAGATGAAERLHAETGGVQRHLYGGRWDTIAGNSIRLIGPGDEVSAEEEERIRAAIQRGELEAEIERMNEEKVVSVPWPITGVESRGGTWVRIRHADGTTADHDFEYLLGKPGVFAQLTADMIPQAGICDGGTVGWETPAGVVDLAPDALWEHAVMGECPGSVCRGWTPAHTLLVRRGQ